MAEPIFHIDQTNQSVSVRLDVAGNSPRTRFYAFIFFLAFIVVGDCFLWRDFSSSARDMGSFIVPLILLLSFPVVMVLGTRRYVMAAYPSDETLYCDRSAFTLSRVRWFDLHNARWETRSYALADVTGIRYAAVSRLKQGSIYGLRFTVGGGEQRVLPGLKPKEADTILKALKSFGADVPDDPTLAKQC